MLQDLWETVVIAGMHAKKNTAGHWRVNQCGSIFKGFCYRLAMWLPFQLTSRESFSPQGFRQGSKRENGSGIVQQLQGPEHAKMDVPRQSASYSVWEHVPKWHLRDHCTLWTLDLYGSTFHHNLAWAMRRSPSHETALLGMHPCRWRPARLTLLPLTVTCYMLHVCGFDKTVS